MFLELGGGTNRHPRADWDMDPVHGCGPVSGYAAPGGFRHVPRESVDEIYSSHVMEHIAKGDPLIDTMNECWRALKPGGTFTAVFPIVGWTTPMGTGQLVRGFYPWADPTHVNFWWMPEGMQYFCAMNELSLNADYGIQVWNPLINNYPESKITALLDRYRERRWDDEETPFWGVRGAWEGVVMLRKPHAR